MNRRIRRKKIKQFRQRLELVGRDNPWTALIWTTLWFCHDNERREFRAVQHYTKMFKGMGKTVSRAASLFKQE